MQHVRITGIAFFLFLLPIAVEASLPDPFKQPFMDRAGFNAQGGDWLHPNFRITLAPDGKAVVTTAKRLAVLSMGEDFGYCWQGGDVIPELPLPAEKGQPKLFWSQDQGVFYLHSKAYFQLKGKKWLKVSDVPSHLDWAFKFGNAERLSDGSLLIFSTLDALVEQYDPKTWTRLAHQPYPNNQRFSSFYIHPMTVNARDRVFVFYASGGAVQRFDAKAKQLIPVPTPWDHGQSIQQRRGQHSDFPAWAQWLPRDQGNLGFLGVNGKAWYSYVLDTENFEWREVVIPVGDWSIPYGLPTGRRGFAQIEYFDLVAN